MCSLNNVQLKKDVWINIQKMGWEKSSTLFQTHVSISWRICHFLSWGYHRDVESYGHVLQELCRYPTHESAFHRLVHSLSCTGQVSSGLSVQLWLDRIHFFVFCFFLHSEWILFFFLPLGHVASTCYWIVTEGCSILNRVAGMEAAPLKLSTPGDTSASLLSSSASEKKDTVLSNCKSAIRRQTCPSYWEVPYQ